MLQINVIDLPTKAGEVQKRMQYFVSFFLSNPKKFGIEGNFRKESSTKTMFFLEATTNIYYLASEFKKLSAKRKKNYFVFLGRKLSSNEYKYMSKRPDFMKNVFTLSPMENGEVNFYSYTGNGSKKHRTTLPTCSRKNKLKLDKHSAMSSYLDDKRILDFINEMRTS